MRLRPLPSLGSLALLVILVIVLVSRGDEDGDGGGGGSAEPLDGTPPNGIVVPVVDVVDGDTIEVLVDGVEEDVRYIGVDTPEVDPSIGVECFGSQASDANRRLVAGERVRLVFDDERRDRYGRLLAYVYVGERFVNEELVRGGYATTLTIAPNTDFAGRFDRLEQEAGNAGRGLWGECGP
ncbi:MAG: thermonuclease family protein [Solirubrobacterales bacterium]